MSEWETVTTTEPEKAPKALVCKLAEIVAEIDHVEKKGRNEFHKYDYVKAADLAWAVRKKLSERKVLLLSDVVEQRQEKYGDFLFTTIDVLYTFYDGESGEKLCFKVPGTGSDKGDKGLYKAITGSLKYAIRNAFLVPDDSDPEGDSSVDKEAGKQAAAAVAAKKTAAARPANAYGNCIFIARDTDADAGLVLCLAGAPLKDPLLREFLTDQCFAWPDKKGLDAMIITADFEDVLKDICKAKSITLLEGSAPEAGKGATVPPTPQAPVAPIISDFKETKAGFAAFKWNGLDMAAWDKELWPFLKANVGKPAELTFIVKEKGDKKYHNLDKVISLNGRAFDMEAQPKNFARTKDGLV